jgi:hypothetical protein
MTKSAARKEQDSAASKKKRQPRARLPVTKRLYTIQEFCDAHAISRAGFYNLQLNDKAPRITMIGSKKLISEEDAAAWRAKLPVVNA